MKTGLLDGLNRGHMIFALLLMAQFQLWDGVMTQIFVSNGLAGEFNPFVVPLIYNGSFWLFKILGISVVIPLLWFIFKRFPRTGMTAASCLAVFYLAVITWNFLVLFSNQV